MAKRKFKGAATSKAFKSIGAALQASRGEIETKTRRDVDALKLAKLQRAELDKVTISDLTDNARAEEYMLKEKQSLEQKARQTRYDAVAKHAETDVARLKGEAEEAKKYADHWAKLAPKAAAAAGKFAAGAYQLQDTVRGIQEWKELEQSGKLDIITDGKAEPHYKLVYNATKDAYERSNVGDIEGSNAIQQRTINLSTHWAKARFVNWVKENKNLLRADVLENIKSANGQYDEKGAVPFMELGALSVLEELGISRTSRAGRQIVDEFKKWGKVDQHAFYQNRKVNDTTKNIEQLYTTWQAMKGNGTKAEEQLAFNNLVLAFKNGWFKEGGRILDPTKGEGLHFNTADAGIAAMRHIIDNDKEGKIDPTNVREIFGAYLTPGEHDKEWTTDDPIDGVAKVPDSAFWTKRHAKRFEEDVVNYLDKAWVKRQQDNEKKLEANGVVYNLRLDEKLEALGDRPLTIPEIISFYDDISAEEMSDKQKGIAFKKLGYRGSDYTSDGNFINYMRAFQDGRYDDANGIYLQMTKEEKASVLETSQLMRDLDEAVGTVKTGPLTYKRGLAGALYELDQLFKASETEKNLLGQKQLSTSGGKAVVHAGELLIKKMLSTAGKQGVTPKDRYSDAMAEILDLKSKAKEIRVNKNGEWENESELDLDNPFNYITGVSGKKSGSLVYPQFADPDERLGIKAEAIYGADRVEMLDAATRDWANKTDLIPLKTETITTGLIEGWWTAEEILLHPRFVTPKQKEDLARKAEERASYPSMEDLNTDPFGGLLPPNMVAFLNSTQGKKYTKSALVNSMIKPHTDARFNDTGEDATMIKTNNKGFHSRDELAHCYFEACRVQGKVPHRPEVTWYATEGLNAKDAFLKETGIEVIRNDKGTYSYSDRKAFIKAGGVFRNPTFEELQGLGVIDDAVQYKEDYFKGVQERKNKARERRKSIFIHVITQPSLI